jgi:hypothetical protein
MRDINSHRDEHLATRPVEINCDHALGARIMSQVFLLGSGFSRAVSSQLPTLKDLSEAVVDNLKMKGKPDIPEASSPIAKNFEQWLSYLIESPPWLSDGERLRNRGAFSDVAGAVHDVLQERENAVRDHEDCPEWLAHLVRYWQQNQCSVITFNYDTLVEAAWAEQADSGQQSVMDLYPIPLSFTGSRTGAVLGGGQRPPGMQLLKLHGSLNWRYSGPDSPPGDIIYVTGIPRAWTLDKDTGGDDMLSSDRDPMIIPPTAVKSSYYGNRTLRRLWALAAAALREADELVIMGFSLPESDLIVSSMLATNFEINDKSTITPVDFSDPVVGRVLHTFGLEIDDRGVIDEHVIAQYAGLEENALPKWVEAFAG